LVFPICVQINNKLCSPLVIPAQAGIQGEKICALLNLMTFKNIRIFFSWIPDPRPAPLAGRAFNIYNPSGNIVCQK